MIALDVQPYCNNCPYFEAKTDHECVKKSPSLAVLEPSYDHQYVITCRNRERCEEMVKYLRQQRL